MQQNVEFADAPKGLYCRALACSSIDAGVWPGELPAGEAPVSRCSIRVSGGWCYLALVVDLYSRWVVGCALSLSPNADLTCRAMRNALETRMRRECLFFHSDQLFRYKSKKYRQLLWRNGVMQSMSCRGNCLDNSAMERVFRSLKSEWIPCVGYDDIDHATQDIQCWLYTWYNKIRPHKYNGGLSPCEYEEQLKEATRVS